MTLLTDSRPGTVTAKDAGRERLRAMALALWRADTGASAHEAAANVLAELEAEGYDVVRPLATLDLDADIVADPHRPYLTEVRLNDQLVYVKAASVEQADAMQPAELVLTLGPRTISVRPPEDA